jgi:germination protein M
MFKKGIIRRITIATLACLILLITYFFPTKLESDTYTETLSYSDIKKSAVYLINDDALVSRVDIMVNEEDTLKKVKEIINYLTIDSSESKYLPEKFYSIIPSGTKINNLSLEDNLLKIDFSKELLNTTKEQERKMLEAIIYSLTEIPDIKEIIIFVDGEQLTELPFSKEKLPTILDKNFGINKVYEIDSIKNTKQTTIYYGSKTDEVFYYVPLTYVSNTQEDKIEIIIEKLKTTPIYEGKLISYLNANAEITEYQIKEEEIKLIFNKYLLNDLNENNILEEVQYTIYLSMRDTYNVEKIEFEVQKDDESVNFVINALE